MIISSEALVSNSEMIKNYKACREKAESIGKIFVLKNNQPDAVLFSVNEYNRISIIFEYLESLDEKDISEVVEYLSLEARKNKSSINKLVNDLVVKQ